MADPRVERTRHRVLDAVVALLASEGLDAVTHARIAEASGVGRATLYRHWPDVEALLVETMSARHAVQEADPDLLDLPLREAVLRMVAQAVERFANDPLLAAMVGLLERAEREPSFAEVRRRMAAVFGGALDQLLDVATERGEVSADLDRRHAKALLAGPLFFARLVLADPLGPQDVEPHVDAWLRAIEHRPT